MGTLPVEGRDEVKRTNEIKTAIPLLEAIAIAGKDITADALLTQRKFAEYLVEKRQAHYSFTVKGNQPGLLADLQFYFQHRGQPHFVEQTPPDHGRLETRKIWTTTELNDDLDFPHVGQAFLIERQVIEKKTGEYSLDIAYGLTSRTPQEANPRRVLQVNRGHWVIENGCHYVLDWNFDEDRSRIRRGHGPENITRSAPLRHRRDQIPRDEERRPENAPTHAQRAPGLRLSAHDRKLLSLPPCELGVIRKQPSPLA